MEEYQDHSLGTACCIVDYSRRISDGRISGSFPWKSCVSEDKG